MLTRFSAHQPPSPPPSSLCTCPNILSEEAGPFDRCAMPSWPTPHPMALSLSPPLPTYLVCRQPHRPIPISSLTKSPLGPISSNTTLRFLGRPRNPKRVLTPDATLSFRVVFEPQYSYILAPGKRMPIFFFAQSQKNSKSSFGFELFESAQNGFEPKTQIS